jgi:SAM-dependent methyltransferase
MAAWLAFVENGDVRCYSLEIYPRNLMSIPIDRHQVEIQSNRQSWERKPLLRKIYSQFYKEILKHVDDSIPGKVLELGSGIGNLKSHLPGAVTSDLFANPWLDLVCDAYELPFYDGGLSHLVIFDVFHHLEAPFAFLKEARRTLHPGGKVIIFEPFISLLSSPVYGLLHHEPVAFRNTIKLDDNLPRPRGYYAAQGNATRLFFRKNNVELSGFKITYKRALSAWAYLLSGGFSKPSVYPEFMFQVVRKLDDSLSLAPSLFGGRCLVVLTAES